MRDNIFPHGARVKIKVCQCPRLNKKLQKKSFREIVYFLVKFYDD